MRSPGSPPARSLSCSSRRASRRRRRRFSRREMLQPKAILTGHKALIVGIANEDSIAFGCADAFRTAGADLAITWLNEKARPYVEPLAEKLGADIVAPLNVETQGELEALFETIR